MKDELKNIIKAEMKTISEEKNCNRKSVLSESGSPNGILFGFIFWTIARYFYY